MVLPKTVPGEGLAGPRRPVFRLRDRGPRQSAAAEKAEQESPGRLSS